MENPMNKVDVKIVSTRKSINAKFSLKNLNFFLFNNIIEDYSQENGK